MTRYRKKPVEVEAWQVGSDEPMPDWVAQDGKEPNPWHGNNPYYVKDGYNVVILSAIGFESNYEVVS